jgi:hypothetical protein
MRLRLAAVLSLCLTVGACGSEQSRDRDRAQRSSASSRPPIDLGPSPAELAAARARRLHHREEQALRAVRSYYDSIEFRDFDSAWSRLSESVRASFGGYASWSRGYDDTLETRLTALEPEQVSSSSATVGVEIRTVDLDPCADRVVQRFAGTWSLERVVGGRWLAVDVAIDRIAGVEPASTWRECDEAKHPEDYRALTYNPPPPVDPPPVDYDYERPSYDPPDYGGGYPPTTEDFGAARAPSVTARTAR